MKIRKLRLYIETTTFNYFFDEQREGHEDVVRLFEAVKAGEFEGYTSTYVTDELKKAPEPKRSNMLNLIDEFGIIVLPRKSEVDDLGEIYMVRKIIPVSMIFDILHVALASVYELDVIISYNFQHINRDKTRNLTAAVNNELGYGAINISTAKEVLENDNDEGGNGCTIL